MNNYILINRTYAETTPESCAEGDFSDTGFISECEAVSFRELVELMKGHSNPSNTPNDGINVWYSTHWYTKDYATNTTREESIHLHHINTPNAAKYWKWARIAADK